MNRSEHLQWCKNRAMEYANNGDIDQAFASMCSDLRKHEETKNHQAMELGLLLRMTGGLNTHTEMLDFIQGFN